MTVDLSEFLSGFLAEADDHLRSINGNLLLVDQAIQQRSPHPRAIRELFRALHTMKGLAGMVGVEPIVEIAHSMERVLRDAEQHGGRLPASGFEPLLQGTKAISQRVAALASGNAVADAPRDLLDALDAIDVTSSGAALGNAPLSLDESVLAKLNTSEREQLSNVSGARRGYQLVFTPSPERAARGVTITTIRERLVTLAEIVKVVPITDKERGSLSFLILVVSTASKEQLAEAGQCPLENVTLISQARPAPLLGEESGDNDGPGSSAASMLRVDVRRVDAAMDGLGELLVAKFRLARAVSALAEKGVDVRELQQVTEDVQRRIRDVRALVLGLRMIALSELFDRLPILVRGLQTTTGKTVRLRVDVGAFEVDKGVGERLWPVLVHLVRNAIDHGIEAPAERLRAGKPEQGTIFVSCTRSSSAHLEIAIRDDGAGIDAERVAQRANRPVPADEAGLLDLITKPGFSTRDAATATSGRGMGLDIAHRIAVEELGGEMRLFTTPGKGTTFTLRVPVTVAVVDAFRLESATQYFLVPVSSVEELVEVEPAAVVRSPNLSGSGSGAALFSRRGKTMPYLELSSLIGAPQSAPSKKAVVVRRNDQLLAFGVERLIGHHEVIVRPIDDPLVDVPGVAGAADLGDGRPTLLLDLVALSKLHVDAEHAA